MSAPQSEWDPGIGARNATPDFRLLSAGTATMQPMPVVCVATSFGDIPSVDRTIGLSADLGLWVFDFRVVKTGGAGGAGDDIRLFSGATGISSLIVTNVADETVIRTTTIDDAVNQIAAGGTLTFDFDDGGAARPDCTAFVLGFAVNATARGESFVPWSPWDPGQAAASVQAARAPFTGDGTRQAAGLYGFVVDTGAFTAAGPVDRVITMPAGINFTVLDGLVIKTNGANGANANTVDVANGPGVGSPILTQMNMQTADSAGGALDDTDVGRFTGVNDANAVVAAGDSIVVRVTRVGGDASCLVVVLGTVT